MKVLTLKQSFIDHLLVKKPISLLEFNNPANVRKSSSIYVYLPGQRITGYVTGIWEWNYGVGTHPSPTFVDYHLQDAPGSTKNHHRLRYSGGKILLLEEVDSLPYTDEISSVFDAARRDSKWTTTLEGVADGLAAGEEREIVYLRANDATAEYKSTVQSVKNPEDTNIVSGHVSWLDFVRDTEPVDGVVRQEFLFVEKIMNSHRRVNNVVIAKGREIRPDQIKVI